MSWRRLILPCFLGLAIAVACDGPEESSLMEPSFGKVDPSTCDAVSQEQLDDLFDQIDIVYAAAPNSTRTSAKSHVENIAREVCQGDYSQAIKMTWSALQQIDQQVGDLFRNSIDEANALGELWTQIFALACSGHPDACIVVPGGAFLTTGGIGTVNPRRGGAVVTRNGEAAAVADGDDFTGRDDVFLILSRIEGSVLDQGLFPGYSSYEEGYEVLGSENGDPAADGVLIQMCVLEDLPADLTPYDLQLGHVRNGGFLDLLDPIFGGLLIEDACAYATAQVPAPADGWLRSAGRFALSTLQKVLGPEPLRARRRRGVGLGGRSGSFSPFVPMYPYQPLNVGFSGNGEGEVRFVDSGPEPQTITCETGAICPEKTFPVGDQVELTAEAQTGSTFVGWTGDCTVDSNDPAKCTATIDKNGVDVTATFEKATTPLYVDVTNLATAPLTVSVVEFAVGETDGTLLKTCSVGIDATDPPGFDGCDVPEVLIGARVVLTATPQGVNGPWDMEFSGGCTYYQSMKGEGSVSCTIDALPESPETISVLFSH